MIPIIYSSKEKAFTGNGYGMIPDCVSCIVTEERNGIFECDFEYPTNGRNAENIQVGRIILAAHETSGELEPFDIVSFDRGMPGVVKWHAVHVSYRLNRITATGTGIESVEDAFNLFRTDTRPRRTAFSYATDITKTAHVAAADGLPHSVRQMIGGMEGSLLDTFGGELRFRMFTVELLKKRGTLRNLKIRYGLNLLDFSEQYDASGTYTAVVPYWANGDDRIVGDMVSSGSMSPSGLVECIPLDLTEKFKSKPTLAALTKKAQSLISGKATPQQTMSLSYVDIRDMPEYAAFAPLMTCGLCDQVTLDFDAYGIERTFKIAKVVYDVLLDRYDSIELGTLSTSLSEALGVTDGGKDDSWQVPKTRLINGLDLTQDINLTISQIVGAGGYRNDSKTVNLASATTWRDTGIAIEVPAGRSYILIGHANFASNATGRRAIRWLNQTTGNEVNRTFINMNPTSGANTQMQSIGFIQSGENGATLTLQAVQNSGGSLSTTFNAIAIRIG